MLTNSSVKNFHFKNATAGFNTTDNNYSDFQVNMQ